MAEGGKIMLIKAVTGQIELFRSMGFKYKTQEYMVLNFADFATSRSEEFIRTETVIEWAASAPSVRQRHDRLLVIRRLAAALSAEDDRHQIPPPDVFGRASKPRRSVTSSRRMRFIGCYKPPRSLPQGGQYVRLHA